MAGEGARSRFDAFKAMHASSALLLVANAWDAGSARLIESLGARAIGTTSAGMAWASGYPDGDRLPSEHVVGAARSIARVLTVPLSVDIELGYTSSPQGVGLLAVQLAEEGVVGINIEDGHHPPELLVKKIEAIRTALANAGLEMFVNARTDVYLAGLGTRSQRVDEVLRRANLYESAGADGFFVPAIVALEDIRTVAREIKIPLNVMAWERLSSPNELIKAGVRRLSAGAGIVDRVWAHTVAVTGQFLENGELTGRALPFSDIQGLFEEVRLRTMERSVATGFASIKTTSE